MAGRPGVPRAPGQGDPAGTGHDGRYPGPAPTGGVPPRAGVTPPVSARYRPWPEALLPSAEPPPAQHPDAKPQFHDPPDAKPRPRVYPRPRGQAQAPNPEQPRK